MDTPAPLRIALCDDTPALLAQEEALPPRCGWPTCPTSWSAAGRAGTLLAAAEERPFDVAVLDIQMPGQVGIALGRALLARLDPVAFCQTHKSYAVHWPFVERYDKTDCGMAERGEGAHQPQLPDGGATQLSGLRRYAAARPPGDLP